MENYITNIEIRWSDLDPNFHVLHSRYYDFAAFCRMDFLLKNGLTTQIMSQYHVGPILFREECFFKRELKFGDELQVNLKISKLTTDFAKWSMQHEIWKNESILAATINIDAAWMDTMTRKLAIPPSLVAEIFENCPRSENFQLVQRYP